MDHNKHLELNTNDIQTIFAVFELKATLTQTEINNLNNDERNIFLSLPPIDKARLDKIKKEINSCPVEQVLIASMQPYPFSPSIISRLLSLGGPKICFSKPVAIYIFFNLLTFLYFQRQVVPTEQFRILIRGLYRTLKIPDYSPFASFFFQKMVSSAISFPLLYWDEQLVFTVCDFIGRDKNLPQFFYYTFTQICQIVISLNSKKCIDYLFHLINKLYSSKRQCILKEDQTEMIKILTPFTLQFHPKIFDIISSISLVSQCQAVLDSYINFISFLYQHFFEEPIIIKEEPTTEEIIPNIQNIKIPPFNQDVFIEKGTKSFPNGFYSLPPQLFDKIEIQFLYPSSIWGNLSIISPFLARSSPKCADFFFSSLAQFILSETFDKTAILSAASAVIFLMKENATPARLKEYTKLLISDIIFNPNNTIFDKNGINPIINYFRQEIVCILIEKDPDMFMSLIDKKNPLLFAELLGRVLVLDKRMDCFAIHRQFFADVAEVAVFFQIVDIYNHSDTISNIRNIVFHFLIKLAVYKNFREAPCINIFSTFFFEQEITDKALYILKINLCNSFSSQNYGPLVNRIAAILHKCAINSSDNRYNELVIKLAETSEQCLKHTFQIIEPVVQLFKSFMECFKAKPSTNLVLKILAIITVISSIQEDFYLENDDINSISEFIRENELFSEEFHNKLMCILTNSTKFTPHEMKSSKFYFIERPQFLLLFLAAFGTSPLFEKYLKIFSIYCQYSQYNAKKCHDGFLDMVLLKFIAKEHENPIVNIRGLSIQLNILKKTQKKYVIPLMVSILSTKTSNSVAVLFHKLCQHNNPQLLSILEQTISLCSTAFNPMYLISTINMETVGSTLTALDQNFSIAFWFQLSIARITESRPIITFCTLIDKKISFSVLYVNSTLTIKTSNSSGTVVTSSWSLPIIDPRGTLEENKVAATSWHFMGLTCSPGNDHCEINLYYDGVIISKNRPIKIPAFVFSKAPLKVQLGNCCSNDLSQCAEVGYIAKFRCFERCLTKDEFDQIFSECAGNDHILNLSTLTPKYRTKNLIDYYSENMLYQYFLDAFHSNLNINFLMNLKYIFAYSQQSQLSFTFINYLHDCLMLIKNRNFSHYMKIYSIFESITDESLQIEWIDGVLAKVPLWMNSDLKSRSSILSHWCSILLNNYSRLFMGKSRFTDFFIQYELYFNENEEIRHNYLKFLTRLALLNFNNSDAQILTDVLFGSIKKDTLTFYLQLLKNVIPVLGTEVQHACMKFLHKLLQQENGSNPLQIILTLHDLAIIDNELEAIILTNQLPECSDSTLLFKSLISNLDDMPNFYPLFCCLPLSLEYNCRTLVPGSLSYQLSKIRFNEFLWFLWPLILSFNIDEKFQSMIFEFLASATLVCSDKITTIQNICNLSTLLSESMEVPNKAIQYLSALFNVLQHKPDIHTSIFSEILNQCLYNLYFHFDWQSHGNLLLQEYATSPFGETFQPVSKKIPTKQISNIEDLIQFANSKFTFEIGYQIVFNQTGQIESSELFQFSVELLQVLKEKSEYAPIIKHFTSKTYHKSNYIKLFDKMKKEYNEQLNKNIITIMSAISQLAKTSHQFLDSLKKINYDQYELIMNQIIHPPAQNKRQSRRMSITIEFSRSRALCYCGCPSKQRNIFNQKGTRKLITQIPTKKYDLIVPQAFWITIRKKRQIEFRANKEEMLIISPSGNVEKQFSSNFIKYVYFSSDSKFELVTKFGKSYLIDISPYPNTIITKYLQNDQVRNSISKSDWVSNFEYIMKLNKVSGRSFSNKDLYPVYPNVIKKLEEYTPANITLGWKVREVQNPDVSVLYWERQSQPIDIEETMKRNFIPPEFYYCPEIFAEAKIPSWASTPFEFVYKMRKLLESPTVTKSLPHWIDTVWGDHPNHPRKHSALFQQSHHSKEIVKYRYSNHLMIASESPISYANCCGKILCVVSEDNSINFKKIVLKEGEISLSSDKMRRYHFMTGYNNTYFFSCGKKILGFNRNKMLLTIFSAHEKAEQYSLMCGYPDFQQYGDSFIYREDICSLHLADIGRSFRAETDIVCFAASHKYSIIAYATINSFLHIITLPCGSELQIKDLEKAPLKILITECWGFIVVLFEDEIIVFSTNGAILKKVHFPYKIDYWKACRTVEGFDYILFQYNHDTLGAFEVMYPEKQVSLCDATDLIEAHFLMKEEVILIVSKTGKVSVHPISISTLFSELR
ncbi:hypothetical protein TRFO_25273 [Tritrichomonas foetus]|uniref:BEACH domain-containing protein n=1 Tax=Tritrichomonas foetus TaxID=1144522 RepID=A0A1J4KAB2_9EUKA|nr:hypothetical protein TRFO_25273 [Tritrichomonas foetus]|eukprot:OHT06606.1 hypothetical protein TRFO_25273 [Tritrichomonas foetus]